MVRTLIVAMALGLLASAAQADDVKSKKPVERVDVSKDSPLDDKFLVAVAQCNNNVENMLEVEKWSASDKVKDFAKDVKKDHEKFQKNLASTLKNKKIGIVATPDKELIAKLNELRKLDKSERDKTFLTYFIEGHEKALKMAENQKANGKDSDVTDLAKEMIPVIQGHIKKAKALKSDLSK